MLTLDGEQAEAAIGAVRRGAVTVFIGGVHERRLKTQSQLQLVVLYLLPVNLCRDGKGGRWCNLSCG